MPITIPPLDERRYQQLLNEVLARIPAHTPEWTNTGPSDALNVDITDTLARWMGVPDVELETMFPNLVNFSPDTLGFLP